MPHRRFSPPPRWVALAGAFVVCASALGADPPVSGRFTGNGKEAKLAFASAVRDSTFGEPRIKLIFTEKDHSKAKHYVEARDGDFGSALIITIKPDGQLVGCIVSHSGHKPGERGFSSVGFIEVSEFKAADGRLSGRIKTDGVRKDFGQTWDMDIKFVVKAP
jgi:hypothetical protein